MKAQWSARAQVQQNADTQTAPQRPDISRRIWRRYADAPGVIGTTISRALFGQVSRVIDTHLPLLADVRRRWLLPDAAFLQRWDELPYVQWSRPQSQATAVSAMAIAPVFRGAAITPVRAVSTPAAEPLSAVVQQVRQEPPSAQATSRLLDLPSPENVADAGPEATAMTVARPALPLSTAGTPSITDRVSSFTPPALLSATPADAPNHISVQRRYRVGPPMPADQAHWGEPFPVQRAPATAAQTDTALTQLHAEDASGGATEDAVNAAPLQHAMVDALPLATVSRSSLLSGLSPVIHAVQSPEDAAPQPKVNSSVAEAQVVSSSTTPATADRHPGQTNELTRPSSVPTDGTIHWATASDEDATFRPSPVASPAATNSRHPMRKVAPAVDSLLLPVKPIAAPAAATLSCTADASLATERIVVTAPILSHFATPRLSSVMAQGRIARSTLPSIGVNEAQEQQITEAAENQASGSVAMGRRLQSQPGWPAASAIAPLPWPASAPGVEAAGVAQVMPSSEPAPLPVVPTPVIAHQRKGWAADNGASVIAATQPMPIPTRQTSQLPLASTSTLLQTATEPMATHRAGISAEVTATAFTSAATGPDNQVAIPTGASPGVDIEDLVEKVLRQFMQRLAVERERQGWRQFS